MTLNGGAFLASLVEPVLSRPPLDTPGDLQIARKSLSPAETGEEQIGGDGKDPSLGRPVLSSDDTRTQVDPTISAYLGEGGSSEDERLVVEEPVDENAEITHVARRGLVETRRRSVVVRLHLTCHFPVSPCVCLCLFLLYFSFPSLFVKTLCVFVAVRCFFYPL